MRSFKRLPPQLFSFFFFPVLFSSRLWWGPDLTALLVYNDSPCLANPKRMTVVKRKEGEENGNRRDPAVDILYILRNVMEKGQGGRQNHDTLGKKTQL